MIFKAKFENPFDECTIDSFALDIGFDSTIGREIIYFKTHEFEVQRNDDGFVSVITFCNQCVETFDIEEVFLDLIYQVLQRNEKVILFDSNGFEETQTKDELFQG